jgi:hypothetical protein
MSPSIYGIFASKVKVNSNKGVGDLKELLKRYTGSNLKDKRPSSRQSRRAQQRI